MNNLIEQLAAKVLADEKELQAEHELLDRVREFEESSADVAGLQEQFSTLKQEIESLEIQKSTLKSLDNLKLVPAAEGLLILYSRHIKKLSPEAQMKLENAYLRASGFILGSLDAWTESATGKVMMRQPAIAAVVSRAMQPIETGIVAGLQTRENIIMKRPPAKPESAKSEGRV